MNPGSEVAEQYRAIRNNIRFASGRDRLGTIAVTSPSVGDGKSIAAVNLAICMAQRGDQVLLIDANVRNPILNFVFNLQSSMGLIDVLSQQAELHEAIQETGIEGLSILLSGSTHYNAADLLDSQAMVSLLKQASEQYDAIVLDCSPVGESADACALASMCDGVILVMNSGKTQQEKAIEATRSLEFGKANILGAILNKSRG